jgi:hypothetical protein
MDVEDLENCKKECSRMLSEFEITRIGKFHSESCVVR